MHWVVQDNLWHDQEYGNLLDALSRFDIPHDIVKIVPFSHELIPDVNPTGLVIAYGGTLLAQIAAKKKWIPGSFLNENHDFRRWRVKYGRHLLNSDAEVSSFGGVTPFWQEFFIRPCADSKSFNGMVTTWDDFKIWQKKVVDLKETYTTLNAKTMVCYGEIKEIWTESRFFVVDGKIATYSQYKRGSRIIPVSTVDEAAISFVQQMIDIWCPARGFVIDVALTPDGYRVIEINCLNSAGLYAINAQKLVEAIEGMAFDE